jgi:adenylate cyclase
MIRGVSKWEKRVYTLGVAVIGALLALFFWHEGWLNSWEAKTWDWRVRIMAEKGRATDDICLILLDQNSLDWGKEINGWPWPWPREVYGVIIDYCKRNGAKALAMDVLYTEPSGYGAQDDATLGKAMAEFGKVCGVLFLGDQNGSHLKWPESFPTPKFKVAGMEDQLQPSYLDQFIYPRASFPIPEVVGNVAMLCNTHLEPDPDGVYRRIKPFGIFDGRHLPVMGLGCFLTGSGESDVQFTGAGLQIGRFNIPLDSKGDAVLRFRPHWKSYKAYSAAAVIQSELQIREGKVPIIRDGAIFKDKYVFFGFSAPGLYDLRPSPVSGVYPGVGIHATFLDNLLSNDFIRHAPLWVALLLACVLSFVCAASVSYTTRIISVVAFPVLMMPLPVLLSLIAYGKGYWLPVMVSEVAGGVSVFLGLAMKYATEGRQKRFIKSAFNQYLSPAVIDQIIAHPERLCLGGERRMLTIFFSDLQGFTTISESLSPDGLAHLLNQYLTAMTDIIIELGGTVDKYEGDAIIAFWNAPLEIPGHARQCVEAALKCQEKLAHMRPDFFARIGHDLHMRIGMNTGYAIVGNFGSHTKFDYTMLGDSVNLASRLEGINKEFGTYTMISEFTRSELGDAFAAREIGQVAVVGRKAPVTVYEPMRREAYESRKEIYTAFVQGLVFFYEGRFDRAHEIFSTYAHEDPPAKAYAAKCRELIKNPPSQWDGVWRMTQK